jgi:hypothetical protein
MHLNHSKMRYGVALVTLLLGVYLLFYIAVPDSADGEAMLAASVSLWRTGNPTVNQVSHTDAIFPIDSARMGAFGADGALYSKKGITPSLALLPFVAAADSVPWLTTRATAMLLNPIVTTLTALALFIFVGWLGYAAGTAFITALLYGVATLSLPYSQTLYGEPLAGLLLLIAVMGVWRNANSTPHPLPPSPTQAGRGGTPGQAANPETALTPDPSASGRGEDTTVNPIPYSLFPDPSAKAPLAVAGLASGLLIGVNTAYIVMAGIIGIAVLLTCWRRKRLTDVLAFALPLALCLIGYSVYNAARFGAPFETGYRFADGEGFNSPFLMGLYGLTISPYRGVFWYSPILLLALPGWLLLRKRANALAWLILILVIAQIAVFAAWWSWDGGVTWGTRFLLPVIPLMCIALAPVVSWARRSAVILIILMAFTIVSVFVQLLGALYSPIPFIAYLANVIGGGDLVQWRTTMLADQLGNLSQSAIVGHIALMLAGWGITPAWANPDVDYTSLFSALGLIAAGLILALVPRLNRRWRVVLAIIAVFLALNIVVWRQAARADQMRIYELAAALMPDAALFAETSLFGSGLMDVEHRADTLVVNAPTAPDDRDARPLFEYALDTQDRLWLLTWFGAADPLNWAEQELFERGAFIRETFAADHRALLFDLRPLDAEMVAGGWQFGDVALDSYDMQTFGDGVSVVLNWSALEPLDQPYGWFVHLLNPAGEIVSQQDRQPLGGYMPTDTWQTGEMITDRLLLPANGVGEGWALRIGWLDPQTGERLPTTMPDGTPVDDGYIVIQIG